MKILTTKTKKVFSPEFGWLQEIRFKLFGITIMTERHFVDEVPQSEKEVQDIEELAMYIEWRNKCQMPFISDAEFKKVIQKF